MEAYIASGVTFFLDLTEEGELAPYHQLLSAKGVVHRRMPIQDVSVPRSPQEMSAVLDTIDEAIKDGQVVYVHCFGGVGRTGTVVGCHLVRRGRSGEAALNELAAMWKDVAKYHRKPSSPETNEQKQFVRNWESLERKNTGVSLATVEPLDRFLGCLLGLAAGDAVGTTLEFKSPGSFTPISDMVGGGPFGLKAGQWTDDTSMALCLAASLVERKGFDALDQMQRYIKWWRHGYMSSTGTCFDIGNATSGALRTFEKTGDPFSGSTDPFKAGNGSLMRLAPVPMFFSKSPAQAIEMAAESSRTTHGAATAVDACRFFSGLLVGALGGADKGALLSPGYAPVPGYWDEHPLHPEILGVANGSYKKKEPPQIRGTGFVVASLEAALWAFHKSTSYREAILLAANLGDDADTTGAICGQLAGACYGLNGIPQSWRDQLAEGELLSDLAKALFEPGGKAT